MVALARIQRLVDQRHQPVDLAENLQAGALGMARQALQWAQRNLVPKVDSVLT